jgi:hypothetical protein
VKDIRKKGWDMQRKEGILGLDSTHFGGVQMSGDTGVISKAWCLKP